MKVLSALKQLVLAAPPVLTDSYPVRAEVLVCEDNFDEMEFLCGLLRFQNVIVTRAYNLAGALESISGPTRFQLAFVDLHLANASGVELVRRIKEGKRGTHPIAVSGDAEKIMLCLEWGYIGVLKKPYSLDAVRNILKVHRLPCSD